MVLALATLAACVGGQTPQAAPRVAVLVSRRTETSEAKAFAVARRLSEFLASEKFVLATTAELARRTLASSGVKDSADCKGRRACIVHLGRLVSADVVVAMEIASVDTSLGVHIELVSVATGKALGTHDFVTVQGASAEAFAANARVLARKLATAIAPAIAPPVVEQPHATPPSPPEPPPAEVLPPPPAPPVVVSPAETAQPSVAGSELRPLRVAARIEGEILGRTWSPSLGVGYGLATRWEVGVMLVPLPVSPTGLGVRPGLSFKLLDPGIPVQPYLVAGLSAFFMSDPALGTNVGVWGAAGVEILVASYFSISAEAPVEFYFVHPARQRTVFVPLAAGLNLRF